MFAEVPLSHVAPAWSAQLFLSPGLSPQAISFDKGPVLLGGQVLCSQDGSQARMDSGRSDHRGVTKAGLVGAKANRLFFVFIGFEPLPQKEVREGASPMLGLGR